MKCARGENAGAEDMAKFAKSRPETRFESIMLEFESIYSSRSVRAPEGRLAQAEEGRIGGSFAPVERSLYFRSRGSRGQLRRKSPTRFGRISKFCRNAPETEFVLHRVAGGVS